MINIQSYEHFSFDLWMTIIRSNPEFKPKRNVLLKNYFDVKKPIEDVANAVRYYDVLFNTISEKTGNHIEREEVFYLILNNLDVNINDISSKDLAEFFKQADQLFLNYLPQLIWKDVESTLLQIKEANKTANILSNTAFIHGNSLRIVLKELGLYDYFSFMIFSDEVGVSKPNIKIFEYLYSETLKLKKVEKNKILHIGDNPIADVNGARDFGVDSQLITF